MEVMNGIKCTTINPQDQVNVFSSEICCINMNDYIKRQNHGVAILVVYNIIRKRSKEISSFDITKNKKYILQ